MKKKKIKSMESKLMFSHCYIIHYISFIIAMFFLFALIPPSLHSVAQEKKVPGSVDYLLMPVL